MPHGSERGSPSKTWALPMPTSTTPGHTASAACSVRLPGGSCPCPLLALHQGAPLPHVPSWEARQLTVTGNCLSDVLSDSLTEQWMTLSETIWISQEMRPIFTWYSLLSRPRLSGSF